MTTNHQRRQMAFSIQGVAFLCIVVFALASCDTNNFEEERFPENFGLIIPGEQLAGVRVNDTYETLRIPLGRQDSFFLVEEIPGHFFAEWDDHGIGVLVEDIDRNGDLDFTDVMRELYGISPYGGRTQENIGRGSSKDSVLATYGEPSERSPGDDIWRYYGLGIDFNFFDGFVYQLKVYEPRPEFFRGSR